MNGNHDDLNNSAICNTRIIFDLVQLCEDKMIDIQKAPIKWYL